LRVELRTVMAEHKYIECADINILYSLILRIICRMSDLTLLVPICVPT
jgi:hypothetical protein